MDAGSTTEPREPAASFSADTTTGPGTGYQAYHEADIVLSDGGTALLRPIRADDGPLLVDFYAKVSEESKYFRFFAPYPTLSQRDVEHFTTVDQHTRVAVIVTIGDEMIAVGRYDQTEPGEAEVAFLVQDAHQNRGLASVLLEHLAQMARENGITRFVAEVLPHNRRMLVVFRAAGYRITDSLDDGVVSLEFQIAPTDSSIDVMSAREHRAEARSVQRLLRPRSIAVVGASRFADKVGQTLLRNVVMGNFAGTVYPINPAAESVAGLPAYPDVAGVPGEIDLAVIAVPMDAVPGVVRECAAKGVKGLVVVSTAAGPQASPVPGDSVESQRDLIRIARRYGMRMIGPHAFGAINTDPALRLNASLADVAPARSRVGVFSQSGALGPVLLASLAAHDLGVSAFVAAGYRGDVSANDMLQYFGEDEATDVVLLYLESVGNPRKFSRIARRLSLTRPVVAVRSGRTSGLSRPHESVPAGGLRVPPAAADAMFAQAGIVLVNSVTDLANTAALLAFQPLPTGDRIAVVGNSEALQLLAADEIERSGLRLHRADDALRPVPNAQGLQDGVAAALADPDADAVLVVLAPSIEGNTLVAAQSLTWAAASAHKPVAAVFAGVDQLPLVMRRLDPAGAPGPGTVPAYASPEAAVGALAKAVEYRHWRDRPGGVEPLAVLPHIDTAAAQAVVDRALTAAPADSAAVPLTPAAARDLLAAYGIPVWPSLPVATPDEAVAQLAELGGEIVLKVTNPQMRQRLDMADVRPNLGTPAAVRAAWHALTTDLGPAEDLGFVVQRMAPRGVPLVLQVLQDDTYGPVVSFGLAGLATDLLGDVAYGVPPIGTAEADRMLRQIRAAPMLFGHEGGERVDLNAVTDLIERLSRLADDLSSAAFVEVGPVLAGSSGLAVLACRAELVRASHGSRQDSFVRRLPRV